MFDDEERVIRAARRWAAIADLDLDNAFEVAPELIDALNAAVRAFERGRKLRPLKIASTKPKRRTP